LIVKCSHCGAITTPEDFEKHKCDLSFNKSTIIEVAYFRDDSQKGKQVITALGLDKVLYTFEVAPRKAIPLILPLSDEISHEPKTDKDFTEPKVSIYRGGISFSTR